MRIPREGSFSSGVLQGRTVLRCHIPQTIRSRSTTCIPRTGCLAMCIPQGSLLLHNVLNPDYLVMQIPQAIRSRSTVTKLACDVKSANSLVSMHRRALIMSISGTLDSHSIEPPHYGGSPLLDSHDCKSSISKNFH